MCVYLLWWFDMYRQDVESIVADFTAPGALLTDPLEETLLMSMSDRTGTAARAQQLPLQPITTHRHVNQPIKTQQDKRQIQLS